MDAAPPSSSRLPIIPFVVLAVSLLLTAAATYYLAAAARSADRARFENAIERTNVAIQRRIDTYVDLLRGGAGLFATEKQITQAQFQAFIDRLGLDERYPGIIGIGVSAHFTAAQMKGIVRRMHEEGVSDFRVHPLNPPRPDYHAIMYFEPARLRSPDAMGYDMSTEPTRRAAMEMARDTGDAVTSGKITLVTDVNKPNKQAGFLIYMPIYYFGGVPTTVELRRLLLAGFAFAPFRADDLMQGILGSERPASGIVFSIYDGPATSEASLLHQSDRENPMPQEARFHQLTRLKVPGRAWTIAYRSRPDFTSSASAGLPGFVASSGVVVSFLLFVLSLSQARSQQRAESVVGRLRANEHALRLSESRFRRLVDANLIGVSFSTLDGRILDGNDEYFRIIGRSRDEARAGKVRWDDCTVESSRDADRAAVAQLHANGICRPFEKEYVRPDGTRVPVLIGVVMLQGSSTDTVGMVLDLTARKQAEREMLLAKETAEAASRLKDEFLATVSHELRTPLNAIFGWSQLLAGGHADAEEIQHGLATIQRSAQAQAQLIDDLLDVSRIVAGKLRLDMRPVLLATVIELAIESARPAADAKGVQIVKRLDPEGGRVQGDANRLQQIVWNLLSNAVKFTPRGGNIEIALKKEDANIVVTVSDSGIGIDQEFLKHIFERFRQADASSTRKYGGLGLGLAIVKHLVELHGGTVSAESAGENLGSTFTVTFPAAAGGTPVKAIGNLAAGAVDLSGIHVLLVEDDADSRELMAHLLRRYKASITTSAGAVEAFAQFQQHQPDVLLSDIGMPDEDGYTLLSRIRALPPDQGGRVPAIALTALARPEDRRRALLAGYQVHVSKPADAVALAAIIANLVNRHN